MATTTKKELTNKIAHKLGLRQMLVRDVVQAFLDECIEELRMGNRLEFRDFGVFETVPRAARKARNPKTGAVVQVPPKTVADFKMGKRMKSLINPAPSDADAAAQPDAPAPAQPPAAGGPSPVSETPAPPTMADPAPPSHSPPPPDQGE